MTGYSNPRRGCCHRTSASTPCISARRYDIDLRQIFKDGFVSVSARSSSPSAIVVHRQIRHEKLLDGNRVERSSSDPDHANPLGFGSPPCSGKNTCMHRANEKCGGLCSLECENSSMLNPSDIGTVHRNTAMWDGGPREYL